MGKRRAREYETGARDGSDTGTYRSRRWSWARDVPPKELIGSADAAADDVAEGRVCATDARRRAPWRRARVPRLGTWLKMTLSSELQRREWSVDGNSRTRRP